MCIESPALILIQSGIYLEPWEADKVALYIEKADRKEYGGMFEAVRALKRAKMRPEKKAAWKAKRKAAWKKDRK